MIFYYTATGNSLYIAKELDKDIKSIPQVLKNNELYFEDDVIGIVVPDYCGELPQTVRTFLQKVKLNASYLFMIITYGKADSIVARWSYDFCQRQGLNMNYIQTILMVDNYLPAFDMAEEKSIEKHIDEQLGKIKQDLFNKINYVKEADEAGKQLYASASKRFLEHPELVNGEAIIMSDQCIGCGVCSKVCPIGNIKMIDGQAVRIKNKCDFCLACVHHCASKAICLVDDKNPNERYRHPQVSLYEIIESNKQ